MEWIERFNNVINYIEENITQQIDYGEIAKIACCSSYHFQRMFTYMAGIPLSEYIRKRKMSLAAVDLQSGNEKVIDIAGKYGYNSPTAFNRAFQSIHRISPSAVKSGNVYVKSFPPLSFKLVVKGVEELNYRIEAKEAFRIIGVSAPLSKELEENFFVIPQMWQNCVINGTIEKLSKMISTSPTGLLGISVCNDTEQWKYFIAVATAQLCPEFEEYTVPATTWAIFPGTGTNQSVQELERRIFTEWLPTSGYEYGNAPDIEVYINPDPENTVFEVWVPVRKKSQKGTSFRNQDKKYVGVTING